MLSPHRASCHLLTTRTGPVPSDSHARPHSPIQTPTASVPGQHVPPWLAARNRSVEIRARTPSTSSFPEIDPKCSITMSVNAEFYCRRAEYLLHAVSHSSFFDIITALEHSQCEWGSRIFATDVAVQYMYCARGTRRIRPTNAVAISAPSQPPLYFHASLLSRPAVASHAIGDYAFVAQVQARLTREVSWR